MKHTILATVVFAAVSGMFWVTQPVSQLDAVTVSPTQQTANQKNLTSASQQRPMSALGNRGPGAAVAAAGLEPVQLHGVVRPAFRVDLPPLVNGMIKSLKVKEGQRVQAGEPLVQLDDDVPRARLAAARVETELKGALRRAQVELRRSQQRLQRIAGLQSRTLANYEVAEAEIAVEQAEAFVEQQQDTLRSAEATRQLAEAQLKQFVILSPINGIVTEVHAKAGAVDPSAPILTISDLSTLEIEMHVPARLFGKIKPGAQLPLDASAPVSRRLNSRVVSVSPIIDSASDTFRCLLSIDNQNLALPAGFRVNLPKTLTR